ncbi:MAG: DUF4124 domain-containing protein [Zoogloeaceae bacterium]|nr:DUF4124 domain-containing protein [Zoogloeaceae bacterium]
MPPFATPLRSLWIVPFALILAMASASAEIYKCPQPGGGMTYQEAPCPGGAPAAIRVDQPGAEAQATARRRAEGELKAAQQLDGEWTERKQAARQAAETRDQERRAHQTRCESYLVDAERHTERARRSAKGSGGQGDIDRAEALRARHFTECFSRR